MLINLYLPENLSYHYLLPCYSFYTIKRSARLIHFFRALSINCLSEFNRGTIVCCINSFIRPDFALCICLVLWLIFIRGEIFDKFICFVVFGLGFDRIHGVISCFKRLFFIL
jgi:hypothetical protein